MGAGCDPHKDWNATLAKSKTIRTENDYRWPTALISLHCYIWASLEKDRRRRGDFCCNCVEWRILGNEGFGVVDQPWHRLPTAVKRLILQYVSWASWK